MTTQDNRKPRILVTAATGKTGTAVTRQLLDKGYPVTALARREDRRSAALANAGATIVVGDLIEPDDLRRAMQGVQTGLLCGTVDTDPTARGDELRSGGSGRQARNCRGCHPMARPAESSLGGDAPELSDRSRFQLCRM